MLSFNTLFKNFIDEKIKTLEPAAIIHLKNFHSKLLEPVNKKNMNIWKDKLNKNDLLISVFICKKTAIQLGYIHLINEKSLKKLSLYLINCFSIFLAFFTQSILPKIYLDLPFSWKLIHKKYFSFLNF